MQEAQDETANRQAESPTAHDQIRTQENSQIGDGLRHGKKDDDGDVNYGDTVPHTAGNNEVRRDAEDYQEFGMERESRSRKKKHRFSRYSNGNFSPRRIDAEALADDI